MHRLFYLTLFNRKRRQQKLTENVHRNSATSQISSPTQRDILDNKSPDVIFSTSAKEFTEDDDISPCAEIRGTEHHVTISDDVNRAESISSDKQHSESKVLPSSGGNVH